MLIENAVFPLSEEDQINLLLGKLDSHEQTNSYKKALVAFEKKCTEYTNKGYILDMTMTVIHLEDNTFKMEFHGIKPRKLVFKLVNVELVFANYASNN